MVVFDRHVHGVDMCALAAVVAVRHLATRLDLGHLPRSHRASEDSIKQSCLCHQVHPAPGMVRDVTVHKRADVSDSGRTRRILSMDEMRPQPVMSRPDSTGRRSSAETASCVSATAPRSDRLNCAGSARRTLAHVDFVHNRKTEEDPACPGGAAVSFAYGAAPPHVQG